METAIREHGGKAKEFPDGISESERLLTRTFYHAGIGLALVGLDGRFIYTNPAYSNITGYSSDELKHITIGKLMLPDDAKVNAVQKQKMLAGKISGYVLEKRYIKKDGSIVWVRSSISLGTDDRGQPSYIIGLTENIDERRKVEEALRESEARFRFMAECMPPKVFTADPTGKLDYLSPQWEEYTGLKIEEMDLSGWTHVLHPEDREENARLWQHSVATGEPFYYEHRLRRSDGEYRWHLSRANAMRDKTGQKIIQWIGSDTDIEELHQSRDLQDRLHTMAVQRKQLLALSKSKDEFIMVASHQLRTPASGVKQYIGLLLEGYIGKLSNQQCEMVKRAYECNERQLRTIDDLLRVAQLDAGQLKHDKSKTDIAKLMNDVITDLQGTIKLRQQTINYHTSPSKLLARIDAKLIYMVLENLLDNASKYSPEGKTINVRLRQEQKSAVIEIEDFGVGIAKKDQQKLFKKFSRVKNPLSTVVGGSGLGLYWVKKVVSMHKGTVGVKSKIHSGSTFTVTLPLD